MALTKKIKKTLTKFQSEMFSKPRHPIKETEKFLTYCHMEEARAGVTWFKLQLRVGRGPQWMQKPASSMCQVTGLFRISAGHLFL